MSKKLKSLMKIAFGFLPFAAASYAQTHDTKLEADVGKVKSSSTVKKSDNPQVGTSPRVMEIENAWKSGLTVTVTSSAQAPEENAPLFKNNPKTTVVGASSRLGAVENSSVIESSPAMQTNKTVGPGPRTNETVVGLGGSATISGGSLKNVVNVEGSTGSNLIIISEGGGGDTVFTGAGSTTIQATSASKGGDIE